MFGENFAEGRTKKVKLPGKDVDSFAAFLSLFYPTRDEVQVTDYWILKKLLFTERRNYNVRLDKGSSSREQLYIELSTANNEYLKH